MYTWPYANFLKLLHKYVKIYKILKIETNLCIKIAKTDSVPYTRIVKINTVFGDASQVPILFKVPLPTWGFKTYTALKQF